MKRRDLERKLRDLGWRFLRHGRKHDQWVHGEYGLSVPRHTEINELTAMGMLKEAVEVTRCDSRGESSK